MKPSISKPNLTRKRPKRLLAVVVYTKDDFTTLAEERDYLKSVLGISHRETKSIEIRHASWGQVGELKFKRNKLGNTSIKTSGSKKPNDNLNRHFDFSALKPKKSKW